MSETSVPVVSGAALRRGMDPSPSQVVPSSCRAKPKVLSPALMEAELMRRVVGGDFPAWFDEHVYRHGEAFTGRQLVERITGGRYRRLRVDEAVERLVDQGRQPDLPSQRAELGEELGVPLVRGVVPDPVAEGGELRGHLDGAEGLEAQVGRPAAGGGPGLAGGVEHAERAADEHLRAGGERGVVRGGQHALLANGDELIAIAPVCARVHLAAPCIDHGDDDTRRIAHELDMRERRE